MTITVDENGITAAEIQGDGEEPFGKPNFEAYAAALIGRTDGNIDAVASATMTRNGITEAVEKARETLTGEEYEQAEKEAAAKRAEAIKAAEGDYNAMMEALIAGIAYAVYRFVVKPATEGDEDEFEDDFDDDFFDDDDFFEDDDEIEVEFIVEEPAAPAEEAPAEEEAE